MLRHVISTYETLRQSLYLFVVLSKIQQLSYFPNWMDSTLTIFQTLCIQGRILFNIKEARNLLNKYQTSHRLQQNYLRYNK